MFAKRFGAVSAVLITIVLVTLARAQGTCSGFVLLDFRSQADIALGNYRGWEGYLQNQPITLTYQFDDEFMEFLGPAGRDAAIEAVESALNSWSQATHGHLSFEPSPWVAVPNDDAIVQGGCWANWSGPSCQQWEQLGFPIDPESLPGWGANIDFFTKPVGFSITSGDITYQMTPGILGFAVIFREGDFIRTADIYLNEAWTWTVASAQNDNAGTPPPVPPTRYACQSARLAAAATMPPDRRAPEAGGDAPTGLTPVFDIETVVLHEVGHALGLDHPNEAQAQGGALIDPFTFQFLPGTCWQSSSVMHGDYNGVKRDLKPADIGGMAYLYIPALPGDLNASGQIDPGDAFSAIQLIGGAAEPSPYEVNIMDFIERDGQISDLEAASVVQWAFDPDAVAGTVPAWNPGPMQSLPTAMVVTPMFCPPVMVPGATTTLSLKLENPNHRAIRMWTIEAEYDPDLLANPRISDGSLFAGAIWVTPEQSAGRIRFARISLIDEVDDTSGTVVNLEFDVVGVPQPGPPKADDPVLALTDARILVADPVLHVFGDPDAAETLIVHPLPIVFANLDITGDGRIGTEDWYAFLDDPIDFNGDQTVDEADSTLFLSLMRQSEIADITADLVASQAESIEVD